jgi:hypothetical protein
MTMMDAQSRSNQVVVALGKLCLREREKFCSLPVFVSHCGDLYAVPEHSLVFAIFSRSF